MKAVLGLFYVLLLCILIPSCQDNSADFPVEVDEIPPTDRFICTVGDTLVYKCSDSSYNKLAVKENQFWKETGFYRDMFGGIHKWERQLQIVVLESLFNEWNEVLNRINGSSDFSYSCYIIETPNTIYRDGNPISWLVNGCDLNGKPIFAEGWVKYPVKVLNDNEYYKVYSDSRMKGSNSFEVFWNLKYGIIRFDCVIEGEHKTWDLERQPNWQDYQK